MTYTCLVFSPWLGPNDSRSSALQLASLVLTFLGVVAIGTVGVGVSNSFHSDGSKVVVGSMGSAVSGSPWGVHQASLWFSLMYCCCLEWSCYHSGKWRILWRPLKDLVSWAEAVALPECPGMQGSSWPSQGHLPLSQQPHPSRAPVRWKHFHLWSVSAYRVPPHTTSSDSRSPSEVHWEWKT